MAKPSLLICCIPVVVLIALLALNVYVFGDNALSGANQMALIAASAIAAVLALRTGSDWVTLQESMVASVGVATPAILILLMVGALSGIWLLGGIIPSMIYFGLYILSPQIFLVAACLISAVVSLATGSSWSTSATVGIALMGIGVSLDLNAGMVAGAVLSGAYFGDKLSPLSDTTNLASGVAGVDLFTHIRYMLYTTGPSFLLAIIVFALLGLGVEGQTVNTDDIRLALAQSFHISWVYLLAPVAVVVMIVKHVPALPALFIGTLIGAVMALLGQSALIAHLATASEVARLPYYAVVLSAFFGETSVTTGNEMLDELLSSGGMAGMLNTIWLILSAMVFGGVMEGSGFLKQITTAVIAKVRSSFQLIAATVGTCLFTNFSASDQYLAVIVPGQMYRRAFKEQGLAPQNLSRTLEDSGTVTSVLIPWNTCGAFHASVLGVSTLSYAPFAVFCYLSPLMTLVVAGLGLRIATHKPEFS